VKPIVRDVAVLRCTLSTTGGLTTSTRYRRGSLHTYNYKCMGINFCYLIYCCWKGILFPEVGGKSGTTCIGAGKTKLISRGAHYSSFS
jgi:hypothetical protein